MHTTGTFQYCITRTSFLTIRQRSTFIYVPAIVVETRGFGVPRRNNRCFAIIWVSVHFPVWNRGHFT